MTNLPQGEDEDVYGDFEDMETGEVVKGSALLARGEGKPDAVTAAAQKAILEATREENRISKAAKKAAFDASVSWAFPDWDSDHWIRMCLRVYAWGERQTGVWNDHIFLAV